MKSRRALLQRCHLYVILDPSPSPLDFARGDPDPRRRTLKIARETLRGGADIIQFRNKRLAFNECLYIAKRLKSIIKKYKALLIINDRLDVAIASGSDGLHVGQGDIDLSLARRLLGKDKLIGVSCAAFSEAVSASRNGADCLGVGPVFKTPIKKNKKALVHC